MSDARALTSVLFVIPTLGTGGSERIVLSLCQQLKSRGFDPFVAAFRGGALQDSFTQAGITTYDLNRTGGIDIRLIWRLIRIIRKHQIHIINCHHFVALFYAFWASRLTRVPLMHTEHSKWEMEQLSGFWDRCFRFFLKRIDQITAVSPVSHQHLKDHYLLSSARLSLTLNGVDVDKYDQGKTKAYSRPTFGLNDSDPVLGCVGNLRTEKNQKLLLKTLQVLNDRGHRWQVVLVGDGPCRNELAQLANDLNVADQVFFLGSRDDAEKIYPLFDVYVLPSRYEGLPLTLLEAMSAGVPVIGTSVLGIREVIDHEKNGLLVHDDDPSDLALTMIVLNNDSSLKKTLTAHAREFVECRFSLERFVDSYEQLFNKITGRLTS